MNTWAIAPQMGQEPELQALIAQLHLPSDYVDLINLLCPSGSVTPESVSDGFRRWFFESDAFKALSQGQKAELEDDLNNLLDVIWLMENNFDAVENEREQVRREAIGGVMGEEVPSVSKNSSELLDSLGLILDTLMIKLQNVDAENKAKRVA
ncbi:hypothetical protein KKC94_03460 [Patescibacteria group bacterium]|nr:hypothetical protein [Patescibacteria group bacterium]